MKSILSQCALRISPCLVAIMLLFPLFAVAQQLEGMASYYADKFDGRPLSVGGTFYQAGFTAASKDLDWGTVVEVTNLSNGKTTQVLINDCGPHARGRIIDLSRAAARELDFIRQGETKVRLRVIRASNSGPTCSRGKWAKKLKKEGKKIPPPPPPWNPARTGPMAPVNTVTPGPTLINPASPVSPGYTRGMAGYYPDRFQGLATSTGEIYDHVKFTAASKTFAYGAQLEVTNIVTGSKTRVVVNDCGPNSADRIIDLSRAAAAEIGLISAGSAAVEIRLVKAGTKGPTCKPDIAVQAQESAPDNPGRTPPPAAGTSAAGGDLVEAFQLQVGAFGNPANAAAVVNTLTLAGLAGTYSVTSGDLTKVFTGLSATEQEIKATELLVTEAGYPDAKIVKTRATRSELSGEPPASATDDKAVTAAEISTPASAPQRAYDPTDIMFGVQVGAFRSSQNAQKTVKALREAGVKEVYSARVSKKHRVFAGRFFFQSQAQAEREKLRELGFSGATVRRVQ